MTIAEIPVQYYEQFDADYSLDVPAEAFGGWKSARLPFDLSRTAIVIMHAVDCGSMTAYPGWYRTVEYLTRSNEISRNVFPPLLHAARKRGSRIYHVAMDASYITGLPGYEYTLRVAGCSASPAQLETKPWLAKLVQFKNNHIFPGIHNAEDIQRGVKHMDFYAEAAPLENEPIILTSEQLLSLCQADGIDHLIYIGFAINWCLLQSPGGMLDMKRHGLLCSTVREAVTAVERKETARNELEKESALWRVSLEYGFVFHDFDLIEALELAM